MILELLPIDDLAVLLRCALTVVFAPDTTLTLPGNFLACCVGFGVSIVVESPKSSELVGSRRGRAHKSVCLGIRRKSDLFVGPAAGTFKLEMSVRGCVELGARIRDRAPILWPLGVPDFGLRDVIPQ